MNHDEQKTQEQKCDECHWSNGGLLNVGEVGQPYWMCHGCISRMYLAHRAAPQTEAVDEAIRAAAAMILNPHYENFGKAFQDDVRSAERYIRNAMEPLTSALAAQAEELKTWKEMTQQRINQVVALDNKCAAQAERIKQLEDENRSWKIRHTSANRETRQIQDAVARNAKAAPLSEAHRLALVDYVTSYISRGINGVWWDLAQGIAALLKHADELEQQLASLAAEPDIEKLAHDCAVQVCYDSMHVSTEPEGEDFVTKAQRSIQQTLTRATAGLRSELTEAKEQQKQWAGLFNEKSEYASRLEARIDEALLTVRELRAQFAEAKKDTERLDWLAKNSVFRASDEPTLELVWPKLGSEPFRGDLEDGARDAIDAARVKELEGE